MTDESTCFIFFVFVLTILWNTSYGAILATLHKLENHAPTYVKKLKRDMFKRMMYASLFEFYSLNDS